MIEIMKTNSSELMPETKEEAFGELIGRVNALRRHLMADESRSFYVSGRIVCQIMGFDDVMQLREEKEKAGVGSTD